MSNKKVPEVTWNDADFGYWDNVCPEYEKRKKLVCECGVDKVYKNNKPEMHSKWCPKYRKFIAK